MRIAGNAADLALQFAIARRINIGERRAAAGKGLRVCDATRGSKNTQELVTLATDAPEHPHFLQNHGPGNDGKEKQKQEDAARDPASLR